MPWAVSALKLSANDEQVCLGHYGEKPVKIYIKKNVLNSYFLIKVNNYNTRANRSIDRQFTGD